ncbi:hypothetical protein EDC96DRAFT_209955 [Choanephora cucurbitarum]|nr:hypothetical protein EDC96DRAFT_209955 [Choanephora cucurbitarum]
MSEDEFDMLDLTANSIEADHQPPANSNMTIPEDDFGDDDDDLDLDQLVEVTETVEQQRGQITFVSFGEHDPDPPPPLPESTPSFHPFDAENLRTWIYPTNYTIRGYQFNIVQKAIFNNTLVALPTGLGKTFIAAVVMFNYYRWFPNSKIIFMAPTRPLVEQQIEACYTVCGLPQDDTVDMMGNTSPAKRKELWKSKRVFFATPQTVQKDLENAICPGDKIACIVVDEAHKATGNFAYTVVVKRVSKVNKHFRVLALTATPGSNLDAVQDVVNNLHITQIQIRTEDSMDIREFSHGKNIQHIVVKLSYTEGSTGILPRVVDDYKNKVFGPLLLELSKKPTTVSSDVDRNSSFGLRSARLHFYQNARNLNNALKFQVTALFLVAEHAARAYELLCQHGVVPFVESIDSVLEEFKNTRETGKKLNKSQKAFLDNNVLQTILRNAKNEMSKPDFIGHPKMDKLVSILINHFANLPEGESSKVMIFSSYRTSVQDICQVLNRHAPMLRPSFFVGQASDKNGIKGLKQSEQQEVIQKFKLDVFNILVSTSIGEEGLDIGEVDLIICFDSQSSPIRMLQRMGRTGRKRKGKCILLMTESEERKFQQAKDAYARIQSLIARGGLIKYYPNNPVILPNNYKPVLCRKKLEVGQFKRKIGPKRQKRAMDQEDIYHTSEGFLRPEVKKSFIRSFNDRDHTFSSTEDLYDRFWPVQRMIKSINRFMPIQTVQKPTHRVGHSHRTIQFVHLVQKMEHRILNPNDKIELLKTTTTAKKKQTQLHLPSKGKAKQQTTLFQHLIGGGGSSRSNSSRSKRVNDDDFADFMETHDVAQFIDTDAIFSSEQDSAFSSKSKDKGKSKEASIANNQSKEKEQQDSLSWEPMLPDSLYDEVEPLQDRHKEMQVSLSDSPKIVSDPTSFPITATSSNAAPLDLSSLKDESDDFFDDLDDALLADALMITHEKDIGFDDPLLPEYPFEMDSTVSIKPIQFTWSEKIPTLSFKAEELLKKRQATMKALVGRFISMRLTSHSLPDTTHNLTEPMEIDTSIIVLDDSQPIESPSPVRPVESEQLEEKKDHEHVEEIEQEQPENDEDEFDQFDFMSDGMLANFFENKLSEDDPHEGFSQFMFEEESKQKTSQSQSTQFMAQKSSLYANPPRALSPVEDKHEKEDEVFVFDFNQPMSDSSDNEDKQSANIISSPDSQNQSAAHIPTPTIKSPLPSRIKSVMTTPIVLTSDEEPDTTIPSPKTKSSPNLLNELAKGAYTPSPLRHDMPSSENEESPLVVQRKRRWRQPIVEEEMEDTIEVVKSRRKRLRQRSSGNALSPLDEDLIITPPPRRQLLKRLQQSGYNAHEHHRRHHRHRLTYDANNPFFDMEAEKSSDGGHTTDEDNEEEGESLLDSFINDNSDLLGSNSSVHSHASTDKHIYAQSLLQDESHPNRKHWMNRFDANKWLTVNQEDDNVVQSDDEQGGDAESIQDFSSDLVFTHQNRTDFVSGDDDFM